MKAMKMAGSLLMAIAMGAATQTQALDVCVSDAKEFNDALVAAAGTGGTNTIRVKQGHYNLSQTVLAGIGFADWARPQDLDADRDGKLDRDEMPGFRLKGSTQLSVLCGYTDHCAARHVEADNTHFFDFGTSERLSLGVQENANFELSGCGIDGGMLWIVHAGRGDFMPNTINPMTGHARIVLDRNAFSGSSAIGMQLLIQEEATLLHSSGGLSGGGGGYDGKHTYANLSSPDIRLSQNIFTGNVNPFYCAASIGDRSGEDPGVPPDLLLTGYQGSDNGEADVHYKELGLYGSIGLLHNSVAGNAGCGVALLTSDPVFLSNNLLAANGQPGDLYVDSRAPLYAEFNLLNVLAQSVPGWPYFAFTSIGNFTGKPKFLNLAAANLRLAKASPGVDAATPASILGEPATDAGNQPRIAGHWPDVGAYESQ